MLSKNILRRNIERTLIMKTEQIKGAVQRLIKKLDTSDPFEIAQSLGIIVNIVPLGKIRGMYNTEYRQKFIHINSSLSRRKQRFVCAHELGHAMLHPDNNTHFLRGHTMYSIGRFEKEATYFAACLIISDDDLNEYNYYTHEQLSKLFGVDVDVVRLRVNGI